MGGLAGPLAFTLDPLNITGVQDMTRPQYSAPPPGHTPATPTQAGPKQDPMKGFIESLGGWEGAKFAAPRGVHAAPPPPSQWSYVPGKGPAWSTPERIGATNEFNMNPNLPGSAGFNGFKGNRF